MVIGMGVLKKMVWVSVILLILAVVAGCGEPRTTPEEAALIFCNVGIKMDFTGVEKIGITKEDQPKLMEIRKQALKKNAAEILKEWDIKDTKYTNDLAESLEKIDRMIDIKTELVSKEKNSATVKISIRTIDGDKFFDEVINPALESEAFTKTVGEMSQVNFITQTISKNVDKVTLVKEAKTFETKLTLDEKYNNWHPDNTFGKCLAEASRW
jgi:GTP1/Obg family GTP-binding protein